MVIYSDGDEETDSRLLNLTAHSVDVTLGHPCSESPPDVRFNLARPFPRNSHLRLWLCASKRSTGCSHRSQRCEKGVVFVNASLTHLLGVSQVRKRGQRRNRTWINRSQPSPASNGPAHKACARRAMSTRWEITVAKWNQREQSVVSVR